MTLRSMVKVHKMAPMTLTENTASQPELICHGQHRSIEWHVWYSSYMEIVHRTVLVRKGSSQGVFVVPLVFVLYIVDSHCATCDVISLGPLSRVYKIKVMRNEAIRVRVRVRVRIRRNGNEYGNGDGNALQGPTSLV